MIIRRLSDGKEYDPSKYHELLRDAGIPFTDVFGLNYTSWDDDGGRWFIEFHSPDLGS